MISILKSILKNPYIILLLYFSVLLFVYTQIELNQFGTDDGFFKEAAQTTSPQVFAAERYQVWSSRLAADSAIVFFFKYFEALIPLLGAFVNFCLPLTILSFVSNRRFYKQPALYLYFAIAIFELMPFEVKAGGMYWKTGLFNYAIPALLAVIILNYLKSWFVTTSQQNLIVPSTLAFLTMFFNEQVGITILAIVLSCLAYDIFSQIYIQSNFTLYKIFKRLFTRHYLQLGMLILALSCALSIVLLSPGNTLRTVAEIATWNPAFANMQLPEKIIRGIVWMVQKFILSNLLLPFAILTTFGLHKVNRDTVFICILISGSFISQAIMFFSPTMRASGERIHFIFFTLLALTSTWSVITNIKKIPRPLLFMLIGLAAITTAYHWNKVIT